MLSTFAGVRHEEVARGLASAEELADLTQALRVHLTERGTLIMRLLFQSWGKPAA